MNAGREAADPVAGVVAAIRREWLGRVAEYIRMITDHSFTEDAVNDVLSDALSGQGKMLRPQLLLISAAFGPFWQIKRERLCMLAAIVELIHTASLIHDDIVDEAPMRRGVPSVQGKYGKDAAVYAGDFLIARVNYFESREGLNEAAQILAQTMEQMCIGEIGQAACRYRADVTKEEYLRNIEGKTTALFRAACRIGASESGCDAETTRHLEQIGEYLGILFQLRDDLLDFTGEGSSLGKETHKDFRNGIYTMPVLTALAVPEASAGLKSLILENATRTLTDEEIRRMEEAVIALGGVSGTREAIGAYAAAVREKLRLFPNHAAAAALAEMVTQLEA